MTELNLYDIKEEEKIQIDVNWQLDKFTQGTLYYTYKLSIQ